MQLCNGKDALGKHTGKSMTSKFRCCLAVEATIVLITPTEMLKVVKQALIKRDTLPLGTQSSSTNHGTAG